MAVSTCICAYILLCLFQCLMQGVFMYWITSSLFTMGQISLLKFPQFRALMGIPEMVKHPIEKTSGEGIIATAMSSKFVCANGGGGVFGEGCDWCSIVCDLA